MSAPSPLWAHTAEPRTTDLDETPPPSPDGSDGHAGSEVCAEIAVRCLDGALADPGVVRDVLACCEGLRVRVAAGAATTTVCGRLDDVVAAVERAHRLAASRDEVVTSDLRFHADAPGDGGRAAAGASGGP